MMVVAGCGQLWLIIFCWLPALVRHMLNTFSSPCGFCLAIDTVLMKRLIGPLTCAMEFMIRLTVRHVVTFCVSKLIH